MKELIVSLYDGGYYFSFSIDGSWFERNDKLSTPKTYPADIIYRVIQEHDYEALKVLKSIFPSTRIIFCCDGGIEIYAGD